MGCLTLATGAAQEDAELYRLDTTDYRIDLSVRFFSPYLGKQLSFRSAAHPEKLICSSGNGDSSSCLEKFVGAVAVATYKFQSLRKGVVAAASFREVVTRVAQSDELDPRATYPCRRPLFKGEGSDIQAFGYDESLVPVTDREVLRAEASSRMWAVYRQELFVNEDREPFAVLMWKHTLSRIELTRVCAPSSAATCDYLAQAAGITFDSIGGSH